MKAALRLLALMALAACSGTPAAPPPPAEATTTTTRAPVATVTPPATTASLATTAPPAPPSGTAEAAATASAEAAIAPAPADGKSAWVKPEKGSRPLSSILLEETRKAKEAKLTPFVYIGAPWCPPCQAIARTRDDPRMRAAFAGTYIIELELEAWSKREFMSLGLIAKVIPIFHAVGPDGRSKGRTINGDSWGGSVPQTMAPALAAFFQQNR